MADINLALSTPEQASGWGVASRYIVQELAKRTHVSDLRVQKNLIGMNGVVDGKVFHTIENVDLEPAMRVKGRYNAGYCFFELCLTPRSILNAHSFYDHIFCGSTYNSEVLAEMDIHHTSTLIQGVDMDLFRPITKSKDPMFRDKFVIFSGGKFEYRKGQDLVLAAFRKLQHKYKDLCLITLWQNLWDFSFQTMHLSKHIDATLTGESWVDAITGLCARNRIYPNRVWHYPLLDQKQVYGLIRNSDIGIFPNRCEGGTNLALMEYMACGKPAIASYNTGHIDILTKDNALLLTDQPVERMEPHAGWYADWHEPSLDELISKIEWAYENRDSLQIMGSRGSRSMMQFPWSKTASDIQHVMQNQKTEHPLYMAHRGAWGRMISKLGLFGEGAEVGVYRGVFSTIILANWEGERLHLIDRWDFDDNYKDHLNAPSKTQYSIYRGVVNSFSHIPKVNIIRSPSVEAARGFSDGQLDWVYIDADHSYEQCKADIKAWAPKVRIGGVVGGHDYWDGTDEYGVFGVKSAVDEHIQINGHTLILTDDSKNKLRSWCFVKDH